MATYVVPPVVNEPSSDNSSWNWDWARDGNAILNKGGWSLLGKACGAYVRGSERKSDYHLPHHKLIQGELTLVWGGVRAAMQRLKATNIPLSVKKRVYSHLASHYKHFGKEAPSFAEILAPDEVEQWDKLSAIALEFLIGSLAKELHRRFNVDEEVLELVIEQVLDVVDLNEVIDEGASPEKRWQVLADKLADIVDEFFSGGF